MKKYIYQIVSISLLACLFFACEDENTNEVLLNRGFIEYQYNDTVKLNGVVQFDAAGKVKITKYFNRLNLSKATFAEYSNSTIPDSLKGLRQYELFLYAENGDYNSTIQKAGVSMVQFSMADTLALGSENIASYSYYLKTIPELTKKYVQPFCLSLKYLVNKHSGTVANSFENIASGLKGDQVTVIDLSCSYQNLSNVYQISSKGTYNSFIYRIFYVGEVRKGSPFNP
jgi:hypothetical protein